MKTMRLAAIVIAAAPLLPAQNDSLLYVSRYDSTSLDARAGVLGDAGPFGITGVVPRAGATAFPVLPAAGISAMIGDADNDGVLAEFSGLPQASFGIAGLFVKHADRKTGDASKVYWTVRVPTTTAPKIDVFDGSTVHTIRPGDFVRFLPNGNVEFFIKQEQFMKAAGPQTGNYVEGAGSLCQAPNGDLFYSPPNAPSKNGNVAGGHWVNQPIKSWCNDGAICRIPAADITYDATTGNVVDVKQSSAIRECEEVGSGPQGQPSVRNMCVNSGALDSTGKPTTITFTMIGMEIDPRGTTSTWSWNGTPLPDIIFTFNNTATSCCGGPWGSWRGTIFSTAPRTANTPGSVAKINGLDMGTTTGTASGAWLGLKDGTGSSNAPIARGLAILQTGWKSTAPHGAAVLTIEERGSIPIGGPAAIGVQSLQPNFPLLLAIGRGIAKGGRPAALDASLFGFGGFGRVHVVPPFLALLSLGSNPQGRALINPAVPNDPALRGLNLQMQGVSVGLGGTDLTNPIIAEFK